MKGYGGRSTPTTIWPMITITCPRVRRHWRDRARAVAAAAHAAADRRQAERQAWEAAYEAAAEEYMFERY